MRRGTTPTITLEVEADLTGLNLHVAFAQEGGPVVVKSGNDLTVSVEDSVTTIETTLTQAETLSFSGCANGQVQVRAYNSDGSLAMATQSAMFPVYGILEDGPLPPEEPSQ